MLISSIAAAQSPYLKSNEVILFNFKTTNGKTVMLALDSANKYIVYRYGSSAKVELEYPKEHEKSFDKFKRYYYNRGGGPENAATVVNQVEFVNDGFTYKIYQQSYTLNEGEKEEIGLTVENNDTHKKKPIIGLIKTQKGGLYGLGGWEDSGLIKRSDEPFTH